MSISKKWSVCRGLLSSHWLSVDLKCGFSGIRCLWEAMKERSREEEEGGREEGAEEGTKSDLPLSMN